MPNLKTLEDLANFRMTESGLQARPPSFNNLQTMLAKLCHNRDTCFRFKFGAVASNIYLSPSGLSVVLFAQNSPI